MSKQAQKPKFSVALQTAGYQKLIHDTLGDPKRAQRFVAAISSAVATNPALQECDPGTILSAALLGESLQLSPSPQLGQYYLVPFGKKATFIPGYKGYYELAIRSGQYKRLSAVPVKKGELISYDPFEEIAVLKPISDPLAREVAETTGYYAFYELLNGFRRTLYWSKEKMFNHGKRYSKSFHSKDSFWQKDFDVMALKTMYRQLLALAPKSIDMQTIFESDERAISVDLTPEYETPALPDPDVFDAQPSEEVYPAPAADAEVLSLSDL